MIKTLFYLSSRGDQCHLQTASGYVAEIRLERVYFKEVLKLFRRIQPYSNILKQTLSTTGFISISNH